MPAEDDDEAAGGPPPDPLDRIWLHPTELARFEAEALTAGRGRPRPHPWTVAIVSALAGAMATMAVLFAVGALDDDRDGQQAFRTDDATARLVAATSGGVLAVHVASDRRNEARASGVSMGEGRIVTSAHVLEGADSVTVTGSDGVAHPATVVGIDRTTDIALLAVSGADLPTVPTDTNVEVGQRVLAVAAGEGDHWVSEGVVSAVNRAVPVRADTVIAGLILTDTAAGRQARGGALVDADGEVIGILTAPPGTSSSGLATPIDVAFDVAVELETTGEAVEGWLGVTGGNADNPRGALVYEVSPRSPAARAGLRQGDVIVAVDDDDVTDMAALTSIVRHREPGETVSISVVRNGEQLAVTCEIGAGKDAAAPTTTAVATP